MSAICKRAVSAFSVLALLLMVSFLCVSTAFADDSSNAEWIQPDNAFDSCEWSWDASTNTFKIRPCEGVETGKLEYRLPWKSYSNRVEVIEFEGPIATSICSSLFEDCCNLREIRGFTNLDTSQATSMSNMFAYCESLESVDLSNLNTSKVTDMSNMFTGCGSLRVIDVSSFDTSKVARFGYRGIGGMFFGCASLESLDVSGFDTSSAKSTDYMFAKCSSLKTLDLTNFDTSSVTSMSFMFSESSSLESIDLSGINTGNVEKTSYMFAGCSSLTSIDLSGFDTLSVDNMSNMFSGCKSLKSLNLSKFNTRNVEIFSYMFRNCESLEALNVSNFETSKAKDMNHMFCDCYSLKSLDLSAFDTSSVTDIAGMFAGCSSLKSLDLSNFDTSKVASMTVLFQDCFALESANISNFKITGSCNLGGLFNGCRSLSSIDMSRFDTSELDIDAVNHYYAIYHQEIFPDVSDNPSYQIKIGPKFTLQPYLTMGYWTDSPDSNGEWYEEYAVPFGSVGIYKYCGRIKSIRFPQSSYGLVVGRGFDLPVSIVSRGSIADDQIWTSSNPEVVSVKLDFLTPVLTPLKPGEADIRVTSISSGVTASCRIVVAPDVAGIGSQPDLTVPETSFDATVPITLKGSTIKKLSKLHKGFAVKWSKLSSKYLKQITGYKIKYSTKKSMKGAKTKTVKVSSSNGKKLALKITKLKAKKKYYVQLATYKKVGAKTYYSKWSKVKSVKTK